MINPVPEDVPRPLPCPTCNALVSSVQGTIHECRGHTIYFAWDNEFVDTSTLPIEMTVTPEEKNMILAYRTQQENL